MAHDVFVSHSTLDKPAADAVCHGLEAQGIRCWMAPRDQIAGKPYGQQITEAIRDAGVMVLIFSDNVNNSQAVLNEINLAAAANVTIVPFRIAKVEFNSELNYYLGRTHWLDAFPPPLGPHVDALAATIRRNLPEPGADAAPIRATPQPIAPPPPAPPPHPHHARPNYMPVAIVGTVFVFVLLIVLIGLHGGKPSPASEQATNTIAAAVANAIQEGAKDDDDQPPPVPAAGVNAPSSEAQPPADQDEDQSPGNAVGASNAPPAPRHGFLDKLLHRSAERHGADR